LAGHEVQEIVRLLAFCRRLYPDVGHVPLAIVNAQIAQ
jgi:hypothetical protein